MLFIAGIVTKAWRTRAAKDKRDEGLMERPVISKQVEKSQMQIAVERLENKQAELSKRLDQILEAKPKVAKPKAVKKRTQKTSTRKTISKPKKTA
jgi:adenine C2-methylase RlmN of 23S rRNA A2503 and tRNA A37